MKFVSTCMLATMAAAADISVVSTIFGNPMIANQEFQESLLMWMQRDPTSAGSDCMAGYETFKTVYA